MMRNKLFKCNLLLMLLLIGVFAFSVFAPGYDYIGDEGSEDSSYSSYTGNPGVGAKIIMENIYIKHLKQSQFVCSMSSGQVEKCDYEDRQSNDPRQTVWNVQVAKFPKLKAIALASAYHKGKVLCAGSSPDNPVVKLCDQPVHEQGDATQGFSSYWAFEKIDQYSITFKHLASGQYLCASSNKGEPYTVRKCNTKDVDDGVWSTKFRYYSVKNYKKQAVKPESTFVCPGGVTCEGVDITANLGDKAVCGTDLKKWQCGPLGWKSNGVSCVCPTEKMFCSNGKDDDADGKKDCADSDCFAYAGCIKKPAPKLASRSSSGRR